MSTRRLRRATRGAPREFASLLPQHAALLRAAGVTDDVARERGYRSVAGAAALARLGFAREQRRVPALLAPIRGVSGRIAFRGLLPDAPRTRFGARVDIESPRAARPIVDVPLRVRAAVLDPRATLVVAGSPVAVDAAVARGLCCVGL